MKLIKLLIRREKEFSKAGSSILGRNTPYIRTLLKQIVQCIQD
jgi:hypothetical protein